MPEDNALPPSRGKVAREAGRMGVLVQPPNPSTSRHTSGGPPIRQAPPDTFPREGGRVSRRFLLGSSFALAACNPFAAQASDPPAPEAAPLKSILPCPFGATAATAQLGDSIFVDQMLKHVDQVTPEWELKMERTLGADFAYDFGPADRIVEWAAGNNLRAHGHTLIWYSQGGEVFNDQLLRDRFVAEFDRYITTAVRRYRGRMSGWDVVNEPVAEDGDGLRDCHWSRALGQDGYMVRAFQIAKAADPDAVLFLNEYNLENNPRKGATFLKLVERLLTLGAPIGGIGTQSHLDIEIPAGQIRSFMRDAASLGLPIHVSELDASLYRWDKGFDSRSRAERRRQQVARVGELAEAWAAVPEAQRYAFTTWGLRDVDSWLLRAEGKNLPDDSPVLLNVEGRANPAYQAVVDAFRG